MSLPRKACSPSAVLKGDKLFSSCCGGTRRSCMWESSSPRVKVRPLSHRMCVLSALRGRKTHAWRGGLPWSADTTELVDEASSWRTDAARAAATLGLLLGLTADIRSSVEASAGSWRRSAGKAHVLGLKIDLSAAALAGLKQSRRPLFCVYDHPTKNPLWLENGPHAQKKGVSSFYDTLFIKKFTPT